MWSAVLVAAPRGEIQGGEIRRSPLLVVRRGIVKGEPIERFPFHCAFGSFCHTTKGTYILPPRYVLQRDGLPRRSLRSLLAMTSMVGSSCNACHRERPTGAWRSVPLCRQYRQRTDCQENGLPRLLCCPVAVPGIGCALLAACRPLPLLFARLLCPRQRSQTSPAMTGEVRYCPKRRIAAPVTSVTDSQAPHLQVGSAEAISFGLRQ